jgi:nifR3 family TIM-barrel protein
MVLAPMAGVTDGAFRRIVAKYGKPDVLVTEFTSTDGLCSPGRGNLLLDFVYSEPERPIVAQIFGNKPENFARTAELLAQMGFDGIDINCGCPDKNVEKQGAGASLIRSPETIVALVRACRQGAPHLPVTVKTRLGYAQNEIHDLLNRVLEAEPAAITVHWRTRHEMSKVPARWELAAEAVAVVRASGLPTLLLGNGDVTTLGQAQQLARDTGVDGVMVGRGIYGNPWFFNPAFQDEPPLWQDRLKVMMEHTRLFLEIFGTHKNFATMKKYYKGYVTDFPGAKELRAEVLEARDLAHVESYVRAFFAAHGEDPDAPMSAARQAR